MKGHVGGGSVLARLLGVFGIVKLKSFHVLYTFPLRENVQERLLEMSGGLIGYSTGWVVGHQT